MDMTPVIFDAAAHTGGTLQPYTYQVAAWHMANGGALDAKGQLDVFLRHEVAGKTHDAMKLAHFQKLFDGNGDGRFDQTEIAATLEAADLKDPETKAKDARITAKELLGLAYRRGIIKP